MRVSSLDFAVLSIFDLLAEIFSLSCLALRFRIVSERDFFFTFSSFLEFLLDRRSFMSSILAFLVVVVSISSSPSSSLSSKPKSKSLSSPSVVFMELTRKRESSSMSLSEASSTLSDLRLDCVIVCVCSVVCFCKCLTCFSLCDAGMITFFFGSGGGDVSGVDKKEC